MLPMLIFHIWWDWENLGMINDNLQIQTSRCPNDIFITIDNKKTTYLDFEKKIYSIKSIS